jgi:hypothetical protein
MVAQVSDYPRTVRRVASQLRGLFPHVLAMGVGGGGPSIYSFVLASPEPCAVRRPLPPGLSFVDAGKLESLFARKISDRPKAPPRNDLRRSARAPARTLS